MGGDYTRWTFNPFKDYAEVLKQQGRVDLDADWNELAEILNRRWRAETMDIIGRAVVPENTPDAFLVTPTGPGQFDIGIGRMYVDGLLAECHGVAPLTYDASLGEVQGTDPVPFNQQPYFPDPSPLPTTSKAPDAMFCPSSTISMVRAPASQSRWISHSTTSLPSLPCPSPSDLAPSSEPSGRHTPDSHCSATTRRTCVRSVSA